MNGSRDLVLSSSTSTNAARATAETSTGCRTFLPEPLLESRVMTRLGSRPLADFGSSHFGHVGLEGVSGPLDPHFSMPQTETTEFSSSRVQLSAERRAFTQPCASSRHIAGPAVRRTEFYRTRRFTTAESMLRRCGDIVSGEHQSRMRGPCNWQAGRVSLPLH